MGFIDHSENVTASKYTAITVLQVGNQQRGLWVARPSDMSSKSSVKKLAIIGDSGELTKTPSVCS
jgi:hypothetical protein